jgi:hypothetical protein
MTRVAAQASSSSVLHRQKFPGSRLSGAADAGGRDPPCPLPRRSACRPRRPPRMRCSIGGAAAGAETAVAAAAARNRTTKSRKRMALMLTTYTVAKTTAIRR